MSNLPYQIKFTQAEMHNMAKQVNVWIDATVAIYVNHFYKMLLNAVIGGEFSILINFNKVDVSEAKILKAGTIVTASIYANHQKCLGDSYDKRFGIITEVLEFEADKRYVVKVIGEKAHAYSKKNLTAYENEMTFLYKVAKHEGNNLQGHADNLPMIAYRVYGPEELEIGTQNQRNKIISQTISELERLLDIKIIRQGGANELKGSIDVGYRLSWETPPTDASSTNIILDEKQEAEDAETYNLYQDTSDPSFNERYEEFFSKKPMSKTEKVNAYINQFITITANNQTDELGKFGVGMKTNRLA